MPDPGHDQGHHGEGQADDRQPGYELAVDDVVAMDRLGDQPGQSAPRPLTADRVERVSDPEHREQERHDLDERERDRVGSAP